jgi:hypothetical protein
MIRTLIHAGHVVQAGKGRREARKRPVDQDKNTGKKMPIIIIF